MAWGKVKQFFSRNRDSDLEDWELTETGLEYADGWEFTAMKWTPQVVTPGNHP